MKTQFIVLDGGEGAGKTSLIKKLKLHFGDKIVTTREPGGSPKAEKIREYIFAHPELTARQQFDKFWEAREVHIKETILPALETGKMVICDRFDSSTYAYQICEKKNRELIPNFWENRKRIVGETEPDLYIYMDVDVETGLARKEGQEGEVLNHFDHVAVEDQKRRQEGFREFFENVPHQIVDVNESADNVLKQIVAIVEKRLVA